MIYSFWLFLGDSTQKEEQNVRCTGEIVKSRRRLRRVDGGKREMSWCSVDGGKERWVGAVWTEGKRDELVQCGRREREMSWCSEDGGKERWQNIHQTGGWPFGVMQWAAKRMEESYLTFQIGEHWNAETKVFCMKQCFTSRTRGTSRECFPTQKGRFQRTLWL